MTEERPEANSNPNLLRDRLANERTFLAWLRAAITVTALGFVVARFEVLLFEVARSDGREFDQSELAIIIGLALVAAGPVMVIYSARRYFRVDRALREDQPVGEKSAMPLVALVSAGLALAGLGMIGHLVAAWPT